MLVNQTGDLQTTTKTSNLLISLAHVGM